MTMRRGDIVLVDYPFSSGRGMKRRPALVVQKDRNNRRLTNTILVAITSTTHRASRAATQLLIDPSTPDGEQSGLLFPSVVTCENILTVEQQLVRGTIGSLPKSVMTKVDTCLKASLGL